MRDKAFVFSVNKLMRTGLYSQEKGFRRVFSVR